MAESANPVSEKKQHWNDYSSLQKGVFLSDEQLRALQELLAVMLRDIVGVCDKYQIPYFLVGGTALGAVRHSGFIPWDDDIDIAMFRKDYERFLSCFADEFQEKYHIQSPEYTDGYPSLIPRVRSWGNVVRSREDLWTDDAHSGAWVDVFVIENTFDNALLRFLHGVTSLAAAGLLACRKTFAVRKSLRPFVIPGSKYARKVLLRSFIGGMIAWLPVNFWRKAALACNRMCKSGKGRVVTVPAGHWRFFGDMYERKLFTGNRMADFCGLTCRIPVETENYLEHCYGSWQTLPPEEKREKHFFCSFSINADSKTSEAAKEMV